MASAMAMAPTEATRGFAAGCSTETMQTARALQAITAVPPNQIIPVPWFDELPDAAPSSRVCTR